MCTCCKPNISACIYNADYLGKVYPIGLTIGFDYVYMFIRIKAKRSPRPYLY